MPKAILVTKQNINLIIEHAAERGMNLSYLPDNVEYNAEFGFGTYVITDGTPEDHNVTYTEMADVDFENTWKFADTFRADRFVEITRL